MTSRDPFQPQPFCDSVMTGGRILNEVGYSGVAVPVFIGHFIITLTQYTSGLTVYNLS